jgi:hypothetical protein
MRNDNLNREPDSNLKITRDILWETCAILCNIIKYRYSVGDPDSDLFAASGARSGNFDQIRIPDPTPLKVFIINQKR